MIEATAPVIDLEKIKKEIEGLSDEDLRKSLLTLRVREKKTQKKSYGSASAKAYQARAREKRKLLLAFAREKGILSEIDEQANELAEEELANERNAMTENTEE